ncbi:hypothetical protein C8R45DRAFT_1027205 [Mycena sanguinolenta]|nr:hypothetical protein C8R45DRAFT_1027205 [Mycena sanguinolenta]
MIERHRRRWSVPREARRVKGGQCGIAGGSSDCTCTSRVGANLGRSSTLQSYLVRCSSIRHNHPNSRDTKECSSFREERKVQNVWIWAHWVEDKRGRKHSDAAVMNEATERWAHLDPCVCSAERRTRTMRTAYEGHEEIADVDDGGAGREDGVGRATQRRKMFVSAKK